MTDDYRWRTITFFVSSTFSDMDEERDYINRIIAPKLISEFEKRYIHLKFIDLRWGVQTDFEKNQEDRERQVLDVCFDEIRRSRPFFISLLGARYGWIPDNNLYCNFLDTLPIEDRKYMEGHEGASITSLEILYGALCNPKYMKHSLFYLRDDASYNNMPPDIKKQYIEKNNIDKLNKLKEQISSKGEEQSVKVRNYHLFWNNDHFDGLEEWGSTVYDDICREIDMEISSTNDQDPKNWVEVEQRKQDVFRHNACQYFVGFEKEIEEMAEKMVNGGGVHVLGGFSLSGKSAFLSMVYNRIATKDPKATILYHTTGVSTYSCDTNRMLVMWITKLSELLGEQYAIPNINHETDNNHTLNDNSEPFNFLSIFLSLCDKVIKKGNTLYILIDGTNRFVTSEEATNYSWLPERTACLLTTFSNGAINKDVECEFEITNTVNDASVLYMRLIRREEAERLIIYYGWHEYHKKFPQSVINHILEICVPEKELNEDEIRMFNGPYYGYYKPLWIRLIVHCLASMTVSDYKQTRIEGSKDPQKDIEDYMNSFVSEVPASITLLVRNFMPHKLPFDYRIAVVMVDFLALSCSGLSERDLLSIANGITPLQFSLFRLFYRPILAEDQQTGTWKFLYQEFSLGIDSLIDVKLSQLYYNALAEHFSFKHVNEGYLYAREAVFYNYCIENQEAFALVCISPNLDVMRDVAVELTERIIIAKQFDGKDTIPWIIDSFQTLKSEERRCNVAELAVLVADKMYDKSLELTIKWSDSVLPFVESTGLSNQCAELCRLLSLSFHRTKNKEKELYYSKKGLQYCEKGANATMKFKAILNMAISAASENADEAESYLKESLFMLEHDLQNHGNNEWHASCKMEIYANLLTIYFQNGLIDKFVDLMPKAIQLADRVVHINSCLYYCSSIYLHSGRYLSEYTDDQQEAIDSINKAITLLEIVIRDDINCTEYQIQLGICYEVRGLCYMNMNNDSEAIKDFRKQIKQFTIVLKKNPDDRRTQLFLMIAHCHVVELLWDEEYNEDFINSAIDIVNRTINLPITDIDEGYVMKYIGIAYYRLFKLSANYNGLSHLTSEQWCVFLHQGGLCLFLNAYNEESESMINWAWELLYEWISLSIRTYGRSMVSLYEFYQMYDDMKPTDSVLVDKIENEIISLGL